MEEHGWEMGVRRGECSLQRGQVDYILYRGTKVSLSPPPPSIKSSCLHVHLSYTHLSLAALLKVQTKLCALLLLLDLSKLSPSLNTIPNSHLDKGGEEPM